MRDITTVIDRIIEEIPEDYTEREQVISKLKSIQESASFAAPEIQFLSWRKLQECLNDNFSPIGQTDWKHRIAHIFAGNTADE